MDSHGRAKFAAKLASELNEIHFEWVYAVTASHPACVKAGPPAALRPSQPAPRNGGSATAKKRCNRAPCAQCQKTFPRKPPRVK